MPTLVLLIVYAVLYTPQAMLLAYADGAEHRLPNRQVLALTTTVTVALAVTALALPQLRAPLQAALVLAAVVTVAAVLIALFAPPLLGMGDAKCCFVVTLMATVLGGDVLLAGAASATLLAGLFGSAVMLRSRTPGTAIPVGPILLAAPALGLITGPWLTSATGIS
ncbi:hypothetical protein [Brachybacterium timonense]|uniref:hypothetical protein n=1 Tax=Brachybacterium timonense TaxID=2050896 RepID=UPI000D0B60AE|nr:hypothetical protein [Brachybacterium timonense]